MCGQLSHSLSWRADDDADEPTGARKLESDFIHSFVSACNGNTDIRGAKRQYATVPQAHKY